jgi:DNA-binding LacI/PurR family transcriptional regulator
VDRLTGSKNALAQNGFPIEESLLKQGDLTVNSGYLAAKELLQGSGRPTAIFAVNDLMAFGAINAAKELGLHVPRDLSVVGFDNIPLSSYFEPPLTTVEIPIYDLGVASMRMLMDLISGNSFERVRWFKTRLLVRGSTTRKM